jgi:hypothetical protein
VSNTGDADAMLDTLHDPSAWPMFTLPLADGFAWGSVVRGRFLGP